MTLPQGFVLDTPGVPQGFTPDEAPRLKEIGSAPELNEFSMPALKASAGLLMAGNEKGAAGVIEQQFPNATVRPSDDGLVVDLPSGSYRVRGLAQTGAALAAQIGLFIAGGQIAGSAAKGMDLLGRVMAQGIGAGAVQAGIEAGEQALGGEDVSEADVAIAALTGGIAETVPFAWKAGKSAIQDRAFKKALVEAAPSISQIKQTARGLYSQIDDLGATIKPESMQKLADKLRETARKSGFNSGIHPKASKALDEFSSASDSINSLSDVDVLRRVANAARNSIEPDEARIGGIIVDEVDEFLDALKPSDLLTGSSKEASKLYGQARELWRRSKKSEMIQEAMVKAKNQASGFENGLRVQFRSILNSAKKKKGFSKDEIASLEKVVQGGGAENIAKAIGKFGFTEGQATSMLLSSMGVAAGAQAAGPVGAVAIPAVGQVSKKMAQLMTRNNAQFADAVVRSGKDAKKIISSYLKFVPASARDPAELASLLLNNKDAMKQASILAGATTRIPKSIDNQIVKDALFYIKSASPVAIREAVGITSEDDQ